MTCNPTQVGQIYSNVKAKGTHLCKQTNDKAKKEKKKKRKKKKKKKNKPKTKQNKTTTTHDTRKETNKI